jgi:hypothetical protein
MEELKRQAAQLDSDVRGLHDSTDKNTEALNRVHERLDKGDRDRKVMVAAMIAAILVIFAVGFVAFRAEKTAGEVHDQRTMLWCPVFARAVGNYNPPAEPGPDATEEQRADYPRKRADYEANYQLIKDGFYNVLRCSNPVIPPSPPRPTG